MKWTCIVTSYLCCLVVVATGRALPAANSNAPSPVERHANHEVLGDIVLNSEQERAQEHAVKRAVDAGVQARFWPNGTVPYEYDPKIGDKYRKAFNKAMNTWENYTCIRFVERTTETHYVILTNSTYCSAGVGIDNNGYSTAQLGPDCDKPGNAMHELGHVIGFWHEQQRPDSGDHISINWANIMKEYRSNYDVFESWLIDSKSVPYDLASIMHYGRRDFSNNGLDTFDVLNKADKPECLKKVGQRITISSRDIEQANILYNCPAREIPSFCELLELIDTIPFERPVVKPTPPTTATIDPTKPAPIKKNIKYDNVISLSIANEEDNWLACRQGGCYKRSCAYEGDNHSAGVTKRNSFIASQMPQSQELHNCIDHKFVIRSVSNKRKVKVGDTVVLEWTSKMGKYLDCSSVSGTCSLTACNPREEEGSNGADECPQHTFKVSATGKKNGDVLKTYDQVQLQYIQKIGHYFDCNSSARCAVRSISACPSDPVSNESDDAKNSCKPASFVVRKSKQ